MTDPAPFRMPPVPKQRRRLAPWVIIAAVVGLVFAVICGAMVLVAGAADDMATGTVRPAGTTAGEQAAAPPKGAPTVEPARGSLTSADVKIKLKTVEKSCYGSAGCSLTVEPQLSWPEDKVADGERYEVTYTITFCPMDDAGPGEEVGTARIVSQTEHDYDQHFIATCSKPGLKVKVDQVEARR
jgi:hypothetical protein